MIRQLLRNVVSWPGVTGVMGGLGFEHFPLGITYCVVTILVTQVAIYLYWGVWE